MQEKTTQNWVKIGMIFLTIMMFVTVFNVRADENEEGLLLCDDSLALENIEFMRRGIEVWNSSQVKNLEVALAVKDLSLSILTDDGCLNVRSSEDVRRLDEDLNQAGLGIVEVINAQIRKINKSGYIEPISEMVDLES